MVAAVEVAATAEEEVQTATHHIYALLLSYSSHQPGYTFLLCLISAERLANFCYSMPALLPMDFFSGKLHTRCCTIRQQPSHPAPVGRVVREVPLEVVAVVAVEYPVFFRSLLSVLPVASGAHSFQLPAPKRLTPALQQSLLLKCFSS